MRRWAAPTITDGTLRAGLAVCRSAVRTAESAEADPHGFPYGTILLAAGALEGLHSTLLRHREPLMTRYTARLLAESLTLDIGAARSNPRVSAGGFDRRGFADLL
ncbi:MAG: hypothetical protein R3E96_09825 [Planctomycetota bacterium]